MKTEYMIVRPLKSGEYDYHAVPTTFPEPDRFRNLLTDRPMHARTWATRAEAEQFIQANAEFAAAHRLYPLKVEASSEADLEDELDGLDLEEQLEVLLDRAG
jgi:hypothetical protein